MANTTLIPEIDKDIGILCYCTNFFGCGGKIRSSVNDFQVTEILHEKIKSSISQSDGYAVYSLTKNNIDTNHALSSLFKKTGLRLRSLGLKDANAITTQYVYSNNKSNGVEKFESDKYKLSRLGFTKKPLSKKNMTGNRFEIKISEPDSDFSKFDESEKILNFYGYQRFGSSRPVTHLIGKSIIQRRYDEAIDYILSYISKYDSKENNRIREELLDPSKYQQMFDQIPPQMDLERIVVSELIKHKNSLQAIRALPINIRRFYVQAYQSYLFNLTLSRAFDFGENMFESEEGDVCYDQNNVLGKYVDGLDQRLAIPFVGYSYYKKTRFDFYISKILKEQEISPRDFYIKEIQEVSNEGGFRNSATNVTDFSASDSGVSFTLSRGSFATIVMREIMKPENPLKSGF